MKKSFCVCISCLIFLLLMACTTMTTTPHIYTNNTNTEFEILGEVLYESANRTGYTELLRAARNLYPDCDYVIDIMVDKRETTMKFFYLQSITNITWIMRGIAIKYKDINFGSMAFEPENYNP